jgi:hypothetical protein
MQAKVLLIGHNDGLSHTRGLLLQRENFRVSKVLGVASLKEAECQDVAVAILCHTLSLGEKQSAIQAVRHLSPRAMILHLHTLESGSDLREHASSSVADGPQELISATLDLIRRWKNHLK